MKRPLLAGVVLTVLLGMAGSAGAQPHYPPVRIPPAPPPSETTANPTRPDDLSGTARRSIAATPDCGPANPQGGIPLKDGNCP
jgi:hypothetical protein